MRQLLRLWRGDEAAERLGVGERGSRRWQPRFAGAGAAGGSGGEATLWASLLRRLGAAK
ncbi:MAG: hypothetical protein ACREC9_11940 [Methylocella sp.]